MTFRFSGLLVAFLIWDFFTAAAGLSALERGYQSLVASEFGQEFVEQVRSGELWDRVQAAANAATDAARERQAAADAGPAPSGEAAGEAAGEVEVAVAPPEISSPSFPSTHAPNEGRPEEPAAPISVEAGDVEVGDVEAPAHTPVPEVRAEIEVMDMGDDILLAIVEAAQATGAHGGYLLHIALRESGLNDSAKAPTSSASGPFQFVTQTWLQTLKTYGPRHGLEDLAGQINRTSKGRYEVADQAALREILSLRHDPRVSALMAAEFTRANEASLSRQLGREVTQGELYVAHVLGAGGAATLIKTVKTQPDALASVRLPAAAKANRWLFYKGGWQPRTVASLYEELTRFMSTREIAQICNADLDFVRHL